MRHLFAASLLTAALLATGCGEPAVPRPAGYFRIDLPEKNYLHYDTPCAYSIEYPGYGKDKPETCGCDRHMLDGHRISILQGQVTPHLL